MAPSWRTWALVTVGGLGLVGGCGDAGTPALRITVELSGDGRGRVRGGVFDSFFDSGLHSPYAIDCPGTCSYSGAPIEGFGLVAFPEPGSTFAGWSGDCEGSESLGELIAPRGGGNAHVCRAAFRRVSDGGMEDAPSGDVSSIDISPTDIASAMDAVVADAPVTDGVTMDAGPPDATSSDTPAADLTPTDLGAADAGARADGPIEDVGVIRACGPRALPGVCTPGAPGCDIVSVSIGSNVYRPGVCAAFRDGSLRCWSSDCGAPGIIEGLDRVRAVRHGFPFVCVVREGVPRPIWCWGINDEAQFGMRAPANSLTPVETSLPAGTLALGGSSGLSLTAPGVFTAWGRNQYGQLGDGTVEPAMPQRGVAPHEVRLAGLRQVALDPLNGGTACGVFDGGDVRCWGRAVGGHFGTALPTTSQSPTPLTVPGVVNAREVVLAPRFACAVRTDNELWCWGAGNDPRMGGAGTTPARVLDRVTQVALGAPVACALRDDGTVWCWGAGSLVGNGGTDFVLTPQMVRGLTGVRSIHAGLSTVCAFRGGADLRCWGTLAMGPGTDGSPTPVAVTW